MGICIVVLTGSKVGTKFRVGPGFAIGRRNGNLILDDDAKVSSVHAKVVLDAKEQPVLVDQDSSNGIVFNGKKVKKLPLMPGVIFKIGRTQFRVIKDENPNLPDFEPPARAHRDENVNLENIPTPKPRNWKEKLTDILDQQERMVSHSDEVFLQAFSPVLVLDFIEGLQTDHTLTLGYGPREAGFSHFDIELTDPDAPDRAFELVPGPGNVEIRDLSNGRLTVNEISVNQAFLEEGDTICVGKTKIKVRYL